MTSPQQPSTGQSSVLQLINDISDKSNLFATLHDFSQRLTKLHFELVDKEGQYLIMPGDADKITAEYCESFIYAVIKTLEHKRMEERLNEPE